MRMHPCPGQRDDCGPERGFNHQCCCRAQWRGYINEILCDVVILTNRHRIRMEGLYCRRLHGHRCSTVSPGVDTILRLWRKPLFLPMIDPPCAIPAPIGGGGALRQDCPLFLWYIAKNLLSDYRNAGAATAAEAERERSPRERLSDDFYKADASDPVAGT